MATCPIWARCLASTPIHILVWNNDRLSVPGHSSIWLTFMAAFVLLALLVLSTFWAN